MAAESDTHPCGSRSALWPREVLELDGCISLGAQVPAGPLQAWQPQCWVGLWKARLDWCRLLWHSWLQECQEQRLRAVGWVRTGPAWLQLQSQSLFAAVQCWQSLRHRLCELALLQPRCARSIPVIDSIPVMSPSREWLLYQGPSGHRLVLPLLVTPCVLAGPGRSPVTHRAAELLQRVPLPALGPRALQHGMHH